MRRVGDLQRAQQLVNAAVAAFGVVLAVAAENRAGRVQQEGKRGGVEAVRQHHARARNQPKPLRGGHALCQWIRGLECRFRPRNDAHAQTCFLPNLLHLRPVRGIVRQEEAQNIIAHRNIAADEFQPLFARQEHHRVGHDGGLFADEGLQERRALFFPDGDGGEPLCQCGDFAPLRAVRYRRYAQRRRVGDFRLLREIQEIRRIEPRWRPNLV